MQILLFVTTLLMALSIISYSRYQGFVERVQLQREYQRHMCRLSSDHLDAHQLKLYEKNGVPREEAEEESEEEVKIDDNGGDKAPFLYRQFNIRPMLTSSLEVAKSSLEYALMKRLINHMYRERSFFLEGLEKYPDLTEELLDAVIRAANLPENKKKLGKIEKLAGLKLEDPGLQEIWYKMLKGTVGDDGYRSLSAYCGMKTTSKKISILLAKEDLLMAIFDDSDLVQEIMKERKKLQLDVKGKRLEKEDAKQQLQQLFGEKKGAQMFKDLLEFWVSTTDPNKKDKRKDNSQEF